MKLAAMILAGGAWLLGCNTIIGLELGEPEESGSGGGASSSTGSNPTSTTGIIMTTVTAGTGGTGGVGGAGECADSMFESPDAVCQTCLEASCCSQLVACSEEGECVALFYCEAGCAEDQACIDACQNTAPAGATALFDALDACITASCESDCVGYSPICDSGLGLSGMDPAIMACAACLGAPGCCEDFTVCAADATCLACIGMGDATACDAGPLDELIQECITMCAADCG